MKRYRLRAPLVLSLLVAMFAVAASPASAQTAARFNSTRPAERVEYWQKRLNEISARMDRPDSLADVRLLFLGDSITDFWTMGDNPWFPGAVGGRAVWNESFGGQDPSRLGLNLGISGDRTEHVLYRILPRSEGGLGELDRPDLNPDVIVLMIGVNNSWDAETPAVDSVVAGVRAVVAAVHARKPDALIVLQSLLPTNEPGRNAGLVIPVNAALAGFAVSPDQAGHVRYLDLYPAFIADDGMQNRALFMDGVHPNEAGYRAWRDRLVPFLSRVRGSGVS
ncbi:MAG: Uncharacterized protein FD125_308 [bacterium]|nr:MAG: Uncharacterized protein FD125_308 [bacterium]